MSKLWKVTIFLLLLAALVIWLSVFSISSKKLKVISCNVGQGDASLMVYKDFEILIDGGPDESVLGCLSRHLPFWDREIEIIILTHPQADHYTGLVAVLERYKVTKILANSLDSGSHTYELLKNQVLTHEVEVVNPVKGTTIAMDLIQLDILHPSASFLAENTQVHGTTQEGNGITQEGSISRALPLKSGSFQRASVSLGVLGASTSSLDPNEFSIVALLRFGSFRFLFTGDAGTEILDFLASGLSEKGEKSINYIKIPHHGSKYSISKKLYELITSGVAVVSVGKNSYGHPSREVIERLSDKGITVLRTDQMGDIVIKTDGKKMWLDK